MAKATKEKVPPNGTNGADFDTVMWGTEKYSILSLPPHALHYLVQYGMNKSRQDAVAGLKKLHTEKGISTEDSAAILEKEFAERLSHILAGTITTRTFGPRKLGIDKFMHDVAVDRIRAACARVGKDGKKTQMPKGKALVEMVENLIAVRPDIRTAAEARMLESERGLDD